MSNIARKRVRTEPNPKTVGSTGVWERLESSGWKQYANSTFSANGPYSSIKVTQDEIHPGPQFGGQCGPFLSVSAELNPMRIQGYGSFPSKFTVNLGGGLGTWFIRYRGGFANPDFTGLDFTNQQYVDLPILFSGSLYRPDPSAFLTLVDKRLRPKLNKANLMQAVIELREAPKMLKDTAYFFLSKWKLVSGGNVSNPISPKGASEDFLNYQFGWVPFVKDIVDVCQTAINFRDILADLIDRNNKWDHREGVLSETSTDQVISTGVGQRCFPSGFPLNQLFDTGGDGVPTRFSYLKREITRVWASGDYKFYRPEFDMNLAEFDSQMNRIQQYLTVYGARINPSVLWKVTPWTWLIDWFSSAGSFIELYTAAGEDNVVSKNLCLMHRQQTEIVLQQSIRFWSGLRTFEFYRNRTCKQRVVAGTPYGFGLTPTSLSGRQWAILGALGLSKFT